MNQEDTAAGDKVRVKSNRHKGERGTIETITGNALHVLLASGEYIEVSSDEVINFSRAARRAWKVMPKRSGRPTGLAPKKKLVSIRIESDTWHKLGLAVEAGLISSREEAVNQWLREHLEALSSEQV